MEVQNHTIEQQLKDAGYLTTRHENGFISFEFVIPTGKFEGQKIEIALDAPQFPMLPPSGPYIKPHLLPFNAPSNVHPYGGIHDRKMPTEEFQYWSRPCKAWDTCERKDIKTYIAFLRTLFDFQ